MKMIRGKLDQLVRTPFLSLPFFINTKNYKMTTLEKLNKVIQFKGFTITFIRSEWRAEAHASPQFCNTNLSKLKKEINHYLK